VAAVRAVDRLVTEGLIAPESVPGTGDNLNGTEWAGRALILLFPSLAEVWLGSDWFVRRNT
jgi:hypothetical protein